MPSTTLSTGDSPLIIEESADHSSRLRTKTLCWPLGALAALAVLGIFGFCGFRTWPMPAAGSWREIPGEIAGPAIGIVVLMLFAVDLTHERLDVADGCLRYS